MNKTVYLAGAISGDPVYRYKFLKAEESVRAAGFTALSPAILPDGFSYDAYIRISRAMLDECEAACFLPDWRESPGAQAEYGRAHAQGKEIMFLDVDGVIHVQSMSVSPLAGEANKNTTQEIKSLNKELEKLHRQMKCDSLYREM